MFKVKICGVRHLEDAVAVAEAGADAIGLNLFSGSPRFVDRAVAETIVEATHGRLITVGVFVNECADTVLELAEALRLDMVQLHGDEPPSFLVDLPPVKVVRAFRCRDRSVDVVLSYLDECQARGRMPDAVLVDAYDPNQRGGTGKTVDWTIAAELAIRLADIPLVLAGGLTPGNVAQAIAEVRPAAVDTASGVEASPGRKSAEKVRQFVAAAMGVLAEPG